MFLAEASTLTGTSLRAQHGDHVAVGLEVVPAAGPRAALAEARPEAVAAEDAVAAW